ncbi:unnamed protein product [Amoebophrya sp. A120]|nr:unnamed protein product [Amoebophrya sp. A120]|eukprot:GSA120T00002554001.1
MGQSESLFAGGTGPEFSLQPIPEACVPKTDTDLPQQAQASNAEAIKLIDAGKHLEAIKRLRAALQLVPESSTLAGNLALCLAKRNEFADAKAMCQRALSGEEHQTGDFGTRLILAWCESKLGRASDAIALYQNLYQERSTEYEILFHMSEAFRDHGDFGDAVETLNFFLQHRPNHFEAQRQLGFCYEQKKDLENAQRTYEFLLKQWEGASSEERTPGFPERETRLRLVGVLRDRVEQQKDEERKLTKRPGYSLSIVGKLVAAGENLSGSDDDLPGGRASSSSSASARRSGRKGGRRSSGRRSGAKLGDVEYRSSLLKRDRFSAIQEERDSELEDSSLLEEEKEERGILSIHEFAAMQQLQKLLEQDPNDLLVLRELCFASTKIKSVAQYGERAFALEPDAELAFHIAESYTKAVQKYIVLDVPGAENAASDPSIERGLRHAIGWYRKTLEVADRPHLPAMIALARLLVNCGSNVISSPMLARATGGLGLLMSQLARPSYQRTLEPTGVVDAPTGVLLSAPPSSTKLSSHQDPLRHSSRGGGAGTSAITGTNAPPSSSGALIPAAPVGADKQRYVEAMEILAAARKMDRTNKEVLELCCACKFFQGNYFAARSYATELRKVDGFNKTALFVLAEVHKLQKTSATEVLKNKQAAPGKRKQKLPWYQELEGIAPRQMERVMQAISESYKERKKFDEATTWVQKGLQAYPGSTKLQCFKMQLELDKRTHNNLLDHTFSDNGLSSCLDSTHHSLSVQTKELNPGDLGSSRQTTVVAQEDASSPLLSREIMNGSSPAKVAEPAATESPTKATKRKNAALRRRSHRPCNENLFEEDSRRATLKRETANAKLETLRFPSTIAEEDLQPGARLTTPYSESEELVNTVALHEQDLGSHRGEPPSLFAQALASDDVFFVKDTAAGLVREGQDYDSALRLYERMLELASSEDAPGAVSDATLNRLQIDARLHMCEIRVRMYDAVVENSLELTTASRAALLTTGVNPAALLLYREDPPEGGFFGHGFSSADRRPAASEEDHDTEVDSAVFSATQHFLAAIDHLKRAERKMRGVLGFDRDRYLRHRVKARTTSSSRKNSFNTTLAAGDAASCVEYSDDFNHDPEGFLSRKFFSCAAHVIYRRSVEAAQWKLTPAISLFLQSGTSTDRAGTGSGGASSSSVNLIEDPLQRENVFSFARLSLKYLLLDDESRTPLDARDQVLLAELGAFLQHEKTLQWIHRATQRGGAAAQAAVDAASNANNNSSQLSSAAATPATVTAGETSQPPGSAAANIPGDCPQALYKPKLLLGCYYANLGNYNQALHHFKIAAKSCPEKLYVRYLHHSILDAAIHASKLDQLVEMLDDTFGPHLLEDLVLQAPINWTEEEENAVQKSDSAEKADVESGTEQQGPGAASGASMKLSISPADEEHEALSVARGRETKASAGGEVNTRKSTGGPGAMNLDWVAVKGQNQVKNLLKFECLKRSVRKRSDAVATPTEESSVVALEGLVSDVIREMVTDKSAASTSSSHEREQRRTVAQHFRRSALSVLHDHELLRRFPQKRLIVARWLREESRFEDALAQYALTELSGGTPTSPRGTEQELSSGWGCKDAVLNGEQFRKTYYSNRQVAAEQQHADHTNTTGGGGEDQSKLTSQPLEPNPIPMGRLTKPPSALLGAGGRSLLQLGSAFPKPRSPLGAPPAGSGAPVGAKASDSTAAERRRAEEVEKIEGMAYCSRKIGDYDNALAYYRQLVDATEGRGSAFAEQNLAGLYYVATVLFKKREMEEAILFARRVILTCQTKAAASDALAVLKESEYRLGACYVASKAHLILEDLQESQWMIKRGLEMREKAEQVHFVFFLGVIKSRLHEYGMAKELLVEALQLSNLFKKNAWSASRSSSATATDRQSRQWKLCLTMDGTTASRLVDGLASQTGSSEKEPTPQEMRNVEAAAAAAASRDSKICVDIRFALAQLYLYQSLYELARQEVEIGLCENPMHVGLLSTKALLYVLQDDEESIAENCLVSIDLVSRLCQDKQNIGWLPLLYCRLGYLYLRAENYENALRALSKCTRCDLHTIPHVTKSVYGSAHVLVALIYKTQGDITAARKHVAEARRYHKIFDGFLTARKTDGRELSTYLHELCLTPGHISQLLSLLEDCASSDPTPATSTFEQQGAGQFSLPPSKPTSRSGTPSRLQPTAYPEPAPQVMMPPTAAPQQAGPAPGTNPLFFTSTTRGAAVRDASLTPNSVTPRAMFAALKPPSLEFPTAKLFGAAGGGTTALQSGGEPLLPTVSLFSRSRSQSRTGTPARGRSLTPGVGSEAHSRSNSQSRLQPALLQQQDRVLAPIVQQVGQPAGDLIPSVMPTVIQPPSAPFDPPPRLGLPSSASSRSHTPSRGSSSAGPSSAAHSKETYGPRPGAAAPPSRPGLSSKIAPPSLAGGVQPSSSLVPSPPADHEEADTFGKAVAAALAHEDASLAADSESSRRHSPPDRKPMEGSLRLAEYSSDHDRAADQSVIPSEYNSRGPSPVEHPKHHARRVWSQQKNAPNRQLSSGLNSPPPNVSVPSLGGGGGGSSSSSSTSTSHFQQPGDGGSTAVRSRQEHNSAPTEQQQEINNLDDTNLQEHQNYNAQQQQPAGPPDRAPQEGRNSLPPKRRPQVQLAIQKMVNNDDLKYGYRLGSGGFGTVYHGVYKGEEVAIKKINIDEFGNMSETQMLEMEKEIEALSHLRHPRLVKFIGACLDYPHLSIITEFMPGGSLHALLHINKVKLPPHTQLSLSRQFVEGVRFLHTQQPSPIVHRDLKSLNLVLDRLLNCKICDFGLTRTMDKTHLSLKDGGNGGSPRYMAPECYESQGKLTEKVDIWAVGCLLNEIYGGRLPFDECTAIQQIVKKLLVDHQGPYIPPHIPAPMRTLIQQCLCFDLRSRLSAVEIFDRLQQIK